MVDSGQVTGRGPAARSVGRSAGGQPRESIGNYNGPLAGNAMVTTLFARLDGRAREAVHRIANHGRDDLFQDTPGVVTDRPQQHPLSQAVTHC